LPRKGNDQLENACTIINHWRRVKNGPNGQTDELIEALLTMLAALLLRKFVRCAHRTIQSGAFFLYGAEKLQTK
jgi:hypothetical protein